MNNKLAVLGLVIIVVITAACIIGMITGVDYGTPVLTDMKQAPGNGHLFGTDTIAVICFPECLSADAIQSLSAPSAR